MNKNKLILIIALSVVIVAALTVGIVLLCQNGNNSGDSSGENLSTNIIWVDSTAPEDLPDPEVTSPSVKYPQKPASEPTVDSSKSVTVLDLVASDPCYTLTQTAQGTVISYSSVESLPAYAYVYIPVENYHAKYHYLKIKANCVGVQRIAIIAVYYEQYALNRPGVTVYNNSVLEGENTFICDLNEGVILNEHYDTVIGEKVTDKKICGFMLMIDSNPKQLIDEFVGEMTITDLGVVDESDPDLALLHSAPSILSWESGAVDQYTDLDLITSVSEKTGNLNALIDYSFSGVYPYVEAKIHNYKSDYTTLKLRLKGQNVKNLTIAIAYSLSTSSTSVNYNYITEYGMKVPTDWEEMEFDFSTLEELTSDFTTTVPGSFVKNLKPIALYFFIDTAVMTTSDKPGGTGTLYVEDISFEKNVDDGTPKVTATWTVTGEGMTKSNVTGGGMGTLTYNKTQGWTPVTLNVSSYNPEYSVLVVKVKFYGAKNLGIALSYGSGNTVIQNSDGNTDTGVVLKHTEEAGTDDKGNYVYHIYEIDFANVKTANGEALTEQSINKIMFYIDAVVKIGDNYQEAVQGSDITQRTMQFVGIEFKKAEVTE